MLIFFDWEALHFSCSNAMPSNMELEIIFLRWAKFSIINCAGVAVNSCEKALNTFFSQLNRYSLRVCGALLIYG